MFFRSSIRRLAYLVGVVIRHSLIHVLMLVVTRWTRLGRRFAVTRLSGPERLRAMVEDMGGTFIKFGQMLALQPDILPIQYCNALFNLLDRVAPFPFAHVEQTFLEEFGKSPREIFDDIEVEPIATASIGQVHVDRADERVCHLDHRGTRLPARGSLHGATAPYRQRKSARTRSRSFRGLRLAPHIGSRVYRRLEFA
jgi:predicted unusual protein kinase regulating ubiquinone biosynthesis (AarF/ABC1/UbiB family)